MATESRQLFRTRQAVSNVRDENIKRDLLRLLDGLEFGLATEAQWETAKWSARTIASIAIGLHQTITPEVSLGILNAIYDETSNVEAVRLGLGYRDYEDAKCDFDMHECVSKPGSKCTTFPTGCGGGSGGVFGFVFKWELVSGN